MKRSKNIHNIDSLRREIYRLELEAKNIENELGKNFGYLRQNYSSMATGSFFSGKKKENPGKGIFNSFIKNENVASFMNNISGHISERVLENIDGLIDSAFRRQNKK
jgi:hypothetical protein